MSKQFVSCTFTDKSRSSPLGTTESIVQAAANTSINSTTSFANVARGAISPSSGCNHSAGGTKYHDKTTPDQETSIAPSTIEEVKHVCWACSNHVSGCSCSSCRAHAVYESTHPDYDPYATDNSSTEEDDDDIIKHYCEECQGNFPYTYDPFEVEWGIEEFQALWRTYHAKCFSLTKQRTNS